jgi:hypothetical protein
VTPWVVKDVTFATRGSRTAAGAGAPEGDARKAGVEGSLEWLRYLWDSDARSTIARRSVARERRRGRRHHVRVRHGVP